MADRAKYIQMGVQSGVYDLNTIRKHYNTYAKGGYLDWVEKVKQWRPGIDIDSDNPTYDYEGFYHDNPDYAWKIFKDKDAHFTDKFKLDNHPTFSDESIYSAPERQGGHWHENYGGGNRAVYEPSEYTKGRRNETLRYLENTGEGYLDGDNVVFTKRYDFGGKVHKYGGETEPSQQMNNSTSQFVDTTNSAPSPYFITGNPSPPQFDIEALQSQFPYLQPEEEHHKYEPSTFIGYLTQLITGDSTKAAYADIGTTVINTGSDYIAQPEIGIFLSALDTGYDLGKLILYPSWDHLSDLGTSAAGIIPGINLRGMEQAAKATQEIARNVSTVAKGTAAATKGQKIVTRTQKVIESSAKAANNTVRRSKANNVSLFEEIARKASKQPMPSSMVRINRLKPNGTIGSSYSTLLPHNYKANTFGTIGNFVDTVEDSIEAGEQIIENDNWRFPMLLSENKK